MELRDDLKNARFFADFLRNLADAYGVNACWQIDSSCTLSLWAFSRFGSRRCRRFNPKKLYGRPGSGARYLAAAGAAVDKEGIVLLLVADNEELAAYYARFGFVKMDKETQYYYDYARYNYRPRVPMIRRGTYG